MSFVDPAVSALQERARLRVGEDTRIPDILKLIEDTAGIPVFLAPLPDGLSGAYQRKRDSAFILISTSTALVRQRFTLAHEYGHHALKHSSRLDTDETLGWGTRDPQEIDANKFAAEFLAPTKAVTNWMEAHGHTDVDLEVVVRVAQAFGISAAAARIALERARFLTVSRAHSEIKAAIDAGQHKTLEARLGVSELADELWRIQQSGRPRKSAETWDKTLAAWEQRYISAERAAGILDISLDELGLTIEQRGIVQVPDEDELDFSAEEDDSE